MRLVYWSIKLISISFISLTSVAQGVQKNLQKAALQFESDSQMRHAIYSLYVVDGKTGKLVFDKNSEIGLAPASCQVIYEWGIV
jgi:D-alanyl-D-alanine carboxypeptidase/D-alanyl-D-alanine-endopeptidase (penicillin-binding protein 4)